MRQVRLRSESGQIVTVNAELVAYTMAPSQGITHVQFAGDDALYLRVRGSHDEIDALLMGPSYAPMRGGASHSLIRPLSVANELFDELGTLTDAPPTPRRTRSS